MALTNTVSRANLRPLDAVTILAYSLVPATGILMFGWDWRQILIFYWLGNISVGIGTAVGILRAPLVLRDLIPKQDGKVDPRTEQLMDAVATAPSFEWVRLVAVVFFAMHYGMFTLGHGIFVFSIVSGGFSNLGVSTAGLEPVHLGTIVMLWLVTMALRLVVGLMRPVPSQSPVRGVSAAYRRIAVLHLSIIFGAFLIVFLHLPAAAALLLIAVNAVVELFAPKQASTTAPPVPQAAQQLP